MPRNKAPIMTLDEAKARFEKWRNNRSGSDVLAEHRDPSI